MERLISSDFMLWGAIMGITRKFTYIFTFLAFGFVRCMYGNSDFEMCHMNPFLERSGRTYSRYYTKDEKKMFVYFERF